MHRCKWARQNKTFRNVTSPLTRLFSSVFEEEAQSLLEWILDHWGVFQFLPVSEPCWSCRWMETVQPPTPPSWASRASTWRRVTMFSSLRKVRNIRKAENTFSFHGSHCLLSADDTEESLNDHDDGSIKENFREQDIYLPIANVARIMKNAVPQTGKVRSSMCRRHWRPPDQCQAAGGRIHFLLRSPKTQRSVFKSVWASLSAL